MKALKKSLLAALLSFSLLLMFSPVEAFAGQPWTQSCNHGDIGTTASTMYAMGRVTTGYDTWGRKVEKVWYKCSLCGYETTVDYLL